MSPQARRTAVASMREATGISIRRSCRLAGVSRTVLAYGPRSNAESEAISARMVELAQERRRFGYRRIHVLLRREGVHANHKRIERLYRLAGLTVRKRRRRERIALERQPLLLPAGPNEVWSMDFVMDRLEDGRKLKALTIVDDFTKESVDIVLDHGMSSHYVARVLDGVVRFRSKPGAIRSRCEVGSRCNPGARCSRWHAPQRASRTSAHSGTRRGTCR